MSLVPYIIVFAILYIVFLVVVTWALRIYSEAYQCSANLNIWCYDDWRCTNQCPDTRLDVNPCFRDPRATGPTGLASCIWGPNNPRAQACQPPEDAPPDPNLLACDCPADLNAVDSCLRGCPSKIENIAEGPQGICCCKDITNPACAVAIGPDGKLIGTGPCAPPSGTDPITS